MECQVLYLGKDRDDSSKTAYAIHFHYPHNEEPISGLKASGYVDTYEDEELRGDEGDDFEYIISFNRTFGSENDLRIYTSQQLDGLQLS
jgi:hypothetical protein